MNGMTAHTMVHIHPAEVLIFRGYKQLRVVDVVDVLVVAIPVRRRLPIDENTQRSCRKTRAWNCFVESILTQPDRRLTGRYAPRCRCIQMNRSKNKLLHVLSVLCSD